MYIYLVTFGNIEKRLLFGIAKNVKETFGFEVRLSSVASPLKHAYDHERKQYVGEKILDYLSTLNYPELLKILALISWDMYAEGFNFVFGLAKIQGREAVVSTFRLFSRDERLFFERVFKEVNHELGHTFGLGHCPDRRCVMSFSNSIDDTDHKSKNFCTSCKTKLKTAIAELTF
ncbi:archaemetzincin family Zn-dependent metalloprotease [Hydrogenobacter thermophilus]|uniref:archaemetzincin family Zn-dependent metalloprotease n=1 Tax=Hydrogenobacter thermophilus TaxID=940 RepID=UPI0030F64F56